MNDGEGIKDTDGEAKVTRLADWLEQRQEPPTIEEAIEKLFAQFDEVFELVGGLSGGLEALANRVAQVEGFLPGLLNMLGKISET